MEAAPLTRRCLHSALQQSCRKITSHHHSSHALSSLPVSHFPARRKRYPVQSTASTRSFSTTRHILQDPTPQPQPVYQSPPEAENQALHFNPSTAPKPSIMADLTKGLRKQNNDYVPPANLPSLNQQLDLLDLMGPDRRRSSQVDQGKLIDELAGNPLPEISRRGPDISLRLKPTLGRTLSTDLTRNIDLTTAFRQLERRCINNNVKNDERTQRIYVRRGQRIKELRSKRWRALFQTGFLHECGRIRRMKKQGW